MKSQTHLVQFHEATVTDRKGREYTIKYHSQVNKSHNYKKKGTKWLDTTDAQSAITPKPTVQELPVSPPDNTAKSDDMTQTSTATNAPKV